MFYVSGLRRNWLIIGEFATSAFIGPYRFERTAGEFITVKHTGLPVYDQLNAHFFLINMQTLTGSE